MNMQQIMAQAQKMQREIMTKKEKIDSKIFEGKSEWVSVKFKGSKDIDSVEILSDDAFDKENKEVLADMILIAINNAMDKIDKETDEILGQYSKMSGMF